jgi:hypothetical protein
MSKTIRLFPILSSPHCCGRDLDRALKNMVSLGLNNAEPSHTRSDSTTGQCTCGVFAHLVVARLVVVARYCLLVVVAMQLAVALLLVVARAAAGPRATHWRLCRRYYSCPRGRPQPRPCARAQPGRAALQRATSPSLAELSLPPRRAWPSFPPRRARYEQARRVRAEQSSPCM